jgi:LmbE family N-acetylglucosaminyl deacetylase
MAVLGVPIEFLGFSDDNPLISPRDINQALQKFCSPKLETIYYPTFEYQGNVQHNLVSMAALDGFGGSEIHVQYMTYTVRGKSRSNHPVSVQDGRWIGKKLRALACYESQLSLDPRMGCWQHFLRDQEEFYA